MKTMKVALLATAALAAVSVSARADDTAAIKAQLEALTARIAQLEAAPAAPVGYSLLTLSQEKAIVIPGLEADKNYGEMAHNIGILPTADAPASTDIQWSGYVRAALVYQEDGHEDDDGDVNDDIDVYARGELTVVAKTETAVGEVGVKMVLRANFDGDLGQGEYDGEGLSGSTEGFATFKDVVSPEAWGWWAMTPELTFGGGYAGSLASLGYGVDGACTCMYTDVGAGSASPSFGDATQLRLTYASGPLSFAVALEDGSVDDESDDDIADDITGDTLGVAGEIKYSGDTVSGEIAAAWRDGGDNTADDIFRAGIGVGFALGDMLALSLSGTTGSGSGAADDYWAASALATVNLSDAVYAELGIGYMNPEGGSNNEIDYLAGLYYNPVDQLTIGLEAELVDPSGDPGVLTAAFVSRWRF